MIPPGAGRQLVPSGRSGRGAALLGALLLSACPGAGDGGPVAPTGPTGPTGPPGTAGWTVLGTTAAGDLTVQLRSDRPLGTGLTLLAVVATDAAAQVVLDATVRLELERAPVGEGRVTAPGLGAPVAGSDGLHRQLVAIPSPAAVADGWAATIGVARPSHGEVTAMLGGVAAQERLLASTFAAGSERWLLAVRFDGALVAGLNPFTASLHRSADVGATWSPVVDANLAVEPFMPSMGHGSSGSVPPLATATPGQYRGALSFSMAGDWETTFTVTRGGVELGRPVVVVYF